MKNVNVLLKDYHVRFSYIKEDTSKMEAISKEVDSGEAVNLDLLKMCVKNRHFDFLHLRREEKIPFVNRIAQKLLDEGVLDKKYVDFESLYQEVERLIGSEKNVGLLMLYDISRMIGYALQPQVLPKDFVYLQSGAKIGAKRLLGLNRLGRKLPVEVFKRFFPNEDSQHIEDILCIYKDAFKDGVFIPKSKKCGMKSNRRC